MNSSRRCRRFASARSAPTSNSAMQIAAVAISSSVVTRPLAEPPLSMSIRTVVSSSSRATLRVGPNPLAKSTDLVGPVRIGRILAPQLLEDRAIGARDRSENCNLTAVALHHHRLPLGLDQVEQ